VLQVFYLNGSNNMVSRVHDGKGWTAEQVIPVPPAAPGSTPTAIRMGFFGWFSVCYPAQDWSEVVMAARDPTGEWHDWGLGGSPPRSDVAMIEANGVLQMFYRRADDKLQAAWRDDKGAWRFISDNMPDDVRSAPVVIPLNPDVEEDSVRVFYSSQPKGEPYRLVTQAFSYREGWAHAYSLSGTEKDAPFAFTVRMLPTLYDRDEVAVLYTDPADGSVSFMTLGGQPTKLSGRANTASCIAIVMLPAFGANDGIRRRVLQYFYDDPASRQIRTRWRDPDGVTWRPAPTDDDTFIPGASYPATQASIATAAVLRYPPRPS
jgi:hypothetical protein